MWLNCKQYRYWSSSLTVEISRMNTLSSCYIVPYLVLNNILFENTNMSLYLHFRSNPLMNL